MKFSVLFLIRFPAITFKINVSHRINFDESNPTIREFKEDIYALPQITLFGVWE